MTTKGKSKFKKQKNKKKLNQKNKKRKKAGGKQKIWKTKSQRKAKNEK